MAYPSNNTRHNNSSLYSMSFKKALIVIIIMIALIYGLFHYLKSPPIIKKKIPQVVTTNYVISKDVPVILHLLGTVIPITNITLTPRVNGHIIKVFYQEGQHVNKGDDLELIDPRPYQASLDQAEGTLAADIAQLEKAKTDNYRYQKLVKLNSTSLMQAKDQEFIVKQLEGQVNYDRGIVENAKLNLMYCHIIAPITGRIGIRNLDMGNYVTIGQTGGLTTLTQMQPISVIFTLPQNQLPDVWKELQNNHSLMVEAWDSEDEHYIATGSVNALDSQIDTATGTVRLRGIFQNPQEILFPNEFINAHLFVKILKNTMILPTETIQNGPNGTFVYLVDNDNTVKIQNIYTGYTNADITTIISGLKLGDQVIAEGTEHLKPGAKVTIINHVK